MQFTPPSKDQIEITLFGPGTGECCIVHYGNGNWLIIDSCVDNRTKRIASLQYLDRIGVSYDSVSHIIATHWHADHIGGLAEALKACGSAKFCASAAMTSEEFISVMSAFAQVTNFTGGNGTEEYFSIVNELRSSKRLPYKMMVADKRLLLCPSLYGTDHGSLEIWSLSPSQAQIDKFLIEMTGMMPVLKSAKLRVTKQKSNDISVVMLITFDNMGILLGADLEETGNPNLGWSAIVGSTGRPLVKSAIFKVPHHGSANGHCQAVWDEMLVTKPLSIATPFTSIQTPLPTEVDRRRLTALSSKLFLAAPPINRKSPDLPSDAAALIRGLKMPMPEIEPQTGTIRVRNRGEPSPNDWYVETDGNAYQVGAG